MLTEAAEVAEVADAAEVVHVPRKRNQVCASVRCPQPPSKFCQFGLLANPLYVGSTAVLAIPKLSSA